jgi:hypothetical protein
MSGLVNSLLGKRDDSALQAQLKAAQDAQNRASVTALNQQNEADQQLAAARPRRAGSKLLAYLDGLSTLGG